MNNGYLDLNISLPFVDELWHDCRSSFYYQSNNGLPLGKPSIDLIEKTKTFFDLDVYVGYYKNDPGYSYPFHRDNNRNCAFNLLLCQPNSDYQSQIIVNNKVIDVEYKPNSLILLDTSNPHNVCNKSKTETRYLLSVGVLNFHKATYVLEHLKHKNIWSG